MSLPARSLRKQVVTRFLAVFLVIGSVSAALFWLAWHLANDRLLRTLTESAVLATEQRLSTLTQGWQRETEALATQITLNRTLEAGGAERWIRLRAYLVAFGESLEFSSLAILDNQGKPVFSLGPPLDPPSASLPAWQLAPDGRALVRIHAAPLWLGLEGGHGVLLLSKPADNRLMANLAAPQIEVRLLVNEQILASSTGNINASLTNRTDQDADASRHPTGSGGEVMLLPPRVRLHIDHQLPAAISPSQFALAAIALASAMAMGLYAVFGEWLRRNVSRIENLSTLVNHFQQTHAIDAELQRRLQHRQENADELAILSTALLELMHSSQARDEENRAYLQTLDILEEAVVELDWQGRLVRHSPAWSRLSGLEPPRGNLYDSLDPEDGEGLKHQISELFSGAKAQINVRLRLAAPQRAGTWLECRFVPADNPVTRVRGVLRDVTQIYLQEKHITHMALHDALTRLPNRILLEDRIKLALRMATRERNKVGIGFIDLDHFKNVNDVLGHKFGDKLLVNFSENLRATLRGVDTLARWGGDEFVVLLPGMDSIEDVRMVADKLAGVSRDAVRIEGQNLAVTFSMGFSIFPDDGENMEVLLSEADRAMFYAKAQGRNTVQFFSDMTRKGLGKKELYIQNKLSAAISHGDIQPWFQPLVDGRTGEPMGLEALARWHDADLGWIPPATFIPMAENLGLIAELGDLILAHTLTVGRRLRDSGHDLLLAVNISKRQLYMPDCIERLLRDARIAGIKPERIMLEITESVAMGEVDYAKERLRALHQAGFKLAIDDFGVGYSSLSQLHEMPVDELKIDMSFSRRVRDTQGAQLIQAIIGMSQALGLATVAEGVEDEETARRLVDLGVQTLQGYHFAKPMPEQELEDWLRDRRQLR
ncbi:MAG: EAL domain-containing protein [Pseudomonadota bacterium]